MKPSAIEKAYEEERRKIELETSLSIVRIQKELVFEELLASGLSDGEIFEILEAWRAMAPKKSATAVAKKQGILVLQGVAACLHEFEILVSAASQKTHKGRIAFNASLANMGRILGRLAVCAIRNEGAAARKANASTIKIFPELIKESERQAIKKSTAKATDARYAQLRKFKEDAKKVAIIKWNEGSTLLHHQMTKFLVEEYQNEEGKYPFAQLPDDPNVLSEKVLLPVIKEAAKEIGRPELICGLKKN